MAKSADDMLKAEFASRLSKLLEGKGWNQSDLARAAEKYLPRGEKFRRDNISSYLNRKALPRPKQLSAIAKVFGVPPDQLLSPRHAVEPPPYLMQPVPGEPTKSRLFVDMRVPMGTALAVLSLLEASNR